MVKPHSSNFRVITTNVLGVWKLRIITVVERTLKLFEIIFQKSSGSGNKCSNPLHAKWGNNDKKLKMASKLSTVVITIFRHLGYERSSGCMFCETCVSKATEVAEMDKSQGSSAISVSLVCNLFRWATAWQNQQNDMCPAKIQICLGIHPVWSVFSGRMPRLIWVFAGCIGCFVCFVMLWPR